MTGREYQTNNFRLSYPAEGVAKDVDLRPRDTGEQTDLAPEGENSNPEVPQTRPAAHTVVTPGAANQKTNWQTPASAEIPTPPSTGLIGKEVTRRDASHRASETSHSMPHRASKTYKDLRDYMLRR